MSIATYLEEVRGEVKNIRWPSKNQAIMYTVLVVVLSLVVAAYLGALDYLFSKAVEILIEQF
jgi:preprotein translocase subunit SecE